jgi:hypothetical protein
MSEEEDDQQTGVVLEVAAGMGEAREARASVG